LAVVEMVALAVVREAADQILFLGLLHPLVVDLVVDIPLRLVVPAALVAAEILLNRGTRTAPDKAL
jgi:hypothetical protein